MTLKEFLNLYFRQRHFNMMPEAVRKQFVKIAWRGEFRGDMESWWKDLVDQAHPFDNKPEPDAIVELSNDDWDELYLKLSETFEAMFANKSSFEENKDANAFLKEYFGDESDKVFSLTKVDSTTRTNIINLLSVVERNPDLKAAMVQEMGGLKEYNALQKSIHDNAFDNPEDKEKIETFVYTLMNINREFTSAGSGLPSLRGYDFNEILGGLHPQKTVQDSDRTKLKKSYRKILNTLHDKPKVAEVFKSFDRTKISEQLEKAIAKTDYTGKITEKDFVQPEYDDRKTLREKIVDTGKKLYDNSYAHRIANMHRDRLLSTIARPIYDAMTAEGINPTDGLKAFIDKADAIKGRLNNKNPKSADYFDWMTKTLKDLSKTSAFAAALRNQREQDELVDNLMQKAALDGKEAEARVAMEVIHAMSYGLFDGRTLNAIKNTEFKLFGDLPSIKGNEVLSGVANAADKTIKLAFTVGGYAVAGAVNGIRRIRDNRTDKQKRDAVENKLYSGNGLNKDARNEKLASLREKQGNLRIMDQQFADRDAAKKERDALRTKIGEMYDALTNGPALSPEERAQKQKEIDETQKELNKAITRYDRLNDWMNEQGFSDAQRDDLRTDIQSLEKQLINPELSDKRKEKLQKHVDSYDQKIAALEEQKPGAGQTYESLMLFWRYLHTHHTKNIFGFRTNLVQKRYEENRAVMHKSFEDWKTKQVA
jgi:hypothetical protein